MGTTGGSRSASRESARLPERSPGGSGPGARARIPYEAGGTVAWRSRRINGAACLSGSKALDATTLKLTQFARSLRFEDLPATAVEAAKARILSALGVSLAAYDMEPVRIARRTAQPAAGS